MKQDDSLPQRIIQSIIYYIRDISKFKEIFSSSDLEKLIDTVIPIFNSESIVLTLPSDINVVGDIHGNIVDLLRIFEISGYPPDSKYLFLGDYVDRGNNGVEVLAYLISLKILYPNHIYLLRGNHETRKVSMNYGFFYEIQSSYSLTLFGNFVRLFYKLPLAAIIADSIFCVHGGISKEMNYISDLALLQKPTEISSQTIPCDILWSDPLDNCPNFVANNRGLECFFNESALKAFLHRNNLSRLIRSHEFCNSGYNYPFQGYNICTAIFSNTDYCGKGNNAAIMYISDIEEIQFHIFKPLDAEKKNNLVFAQPKWLIDHSIKFDLNSSYLDDLEEYSSPGSSPIALKLL
ncbi:Ser/Thr protein phosphatase, putative [Trichomonas vaginalis G3]|uniref:Serine/threonine-protein phosphatase n=1 Tax=Trichomonas vaginalis (strain ATCC PRA-98 / G3) TaxID=412133 RepID=A2DU70_TRIV3|nr:phosphoprotein phosphatase protein [Trichomonas vaginalis G3]EAY16063.1 Ser/Thr protein phosphatase, putative [Trichomonas vaginalis G3]KAI5537271.1 phosphoprotein phosphatase protein [Trichomonas vaginalis G3]|eukprot:XP_001328286.1 Ser/Thr protein phosphatase [Trichomonas vaginalis G3]